MSQTVLSLWKGRIERDPASPHKPSPREIAQDVAERHGLTLEDIRGPHRARRYVIPRQEAMAAIYARCNVSTTWVGRFFGRDHTTVLHALRRVEERARAE